ncbi:Protein rhomboid [Folsomia candida]|uniref:Protein rhomboid n=1 Tax=Folsomia candida TaxID=158441 RepID=A0A226DQH7_FOLCA|nr:Protein rhomboid [Folsomia candida]
MKSSFLFGWIILFLLVSFSGQAWSQGFIGSHRYVQLPLPGQTEQTQPAAWQWSQGRRQDYSKVPRLVPHICPAGYVSAYHAKCAISLKMHESPLRVQNLDESPSNKRRRRATGGSLTPSTSQLVELDNLPWLSDPNLDAIQPPLSFKERTVACPLHLWVNIIGQLIVGTLLEISYNWVKVCAIYLTSVVGGSLSITIFSSLVYASGASAGQYGLLFGHVSALILVSNSAHVGGALTGFLVSVIFLNKSTSHKFKANFSRIAACILILTLLVVCIGINVAFPNRYLQLENESLRFEYRKTHAQHYERELLKSYTI